MLARVIGVTLCATVAVLGTTTTIASATVTSVDGYAPANALVGSVVHVKGTFTNVTNVSFTGASGPVDAGPLMSGSTDNDVIVTVPAGAISGPVTVTDGTDTVTSSVPFGIEVTSISRDAAKVVYPAGTYVRATLSADGNGISGQNAKLLYRPYGTTTWIETSGSQATNASGAVAFLVKPVQTTEYEVRFNASTNAATVTTDAALVALQPALTASLPAVAPILTAQRFTGAVHPGIRGPVQLQRLVSGAWRWVSTVDADSYGRFAFAVKPWTTKGLYTYRIVRPADATHLMVSTSVRRIQVVDRTLQSGMSGPDVSYLQQRLRSLHYDVPAVTGTFGYDTVHAVIAFQKVQGLSRTGVVSAAVWSRLGRPSTPHLRHPLAGVGAIEVDLTHQVLYYAVNGAIVRILDVSTGGGYLYTGSDGQLTRAITPTGHFHVVYKVNRWVTSKLGTLYRPAYFNNSGYAIHGEGAVPVYPASHGCVRITVPAMDRLYAKLTYGMSVWIY